MKNLVASLLAGAGLVVASNAMAADVMPIVVPGPVVVAPAPAAPGFQWSGFYIGNQVGAWRENDFGTHSARAMAVAGFNFEVGSRLVVGFSAQAGINDGDEFEWAVGGRTGLLLGERLLAYGAAALASGPNEDLGMNLTGGIEIGVGRRVGILFEAGVYHEFNNTPFVDHILLTTGVNLYFGR